MRYGLLEDFTSEAEDLIENNVIKETELVEIISKALKDAFKRRRKNAKR